MSNYCKEKIFESNLRFSVGTRGLSGSSYHEVKMDHGCFICMIICPCVIGDSIRLAVVVLRLCYFENKQN